jgi:hypothetical protein
MSIALMQILTPTITAIPKVNPQSDSACKPRTLGRKVMSPEPLSLEALDHAVGNMP